ncbi:hypothetical protein CLAIMM_12020 [Cladophialophora immunda]|nr:hypothetical protein CLAIMM_12020 [Cladophialophora immunda]
MSDHAPTSVIPRPPFDPAFRGFLAALRQEDYSSVEKIRGRLDAEAEARYLAKFPDMEKAEFNIPGPEDNSRGIVTLSVYRSKTSTKGARPAVYNIHGGGQISRDRFAGLEAVGDWFSGIDVVLVSVEYRLAPEHPAPAALNDSFAGLVWVAEHAANLGIDPSKIMVLGVSGGAPIAAACAVLARDWRHPNLCAQLLSTPMLDDRVNSVSARQFEDDGLWSARTNRMAWDCVLGSERGGPNVSELVSPSRATDLKGVAPAFIDVGDAEVFRDEAVAYASVLWKSGISTELHVWPGGFHAFDIFVPDAPVSKAAIAAKRSWIRRVLAHSDASRDLGKRAVL